MIGVGAGAVSAVSAKQSADAEASAQDYNVKVAEQNARVENDKAAYEAARIRDRNRRTRAEQRGEYVASGLALSGSPEDVIYDSDIQGELDALAAVYSGKINSVARTSEANLARMRGKSATAGLGLTYAGAALGTAGGAIKTYSSYKAGQRKSG